MAGLGNIFNDLDNMLNQMSEEEKHELFEEANKEFMEIENRRKSENDKMIQELDRITDMVKEKLPEYKNSKIGKQLTKIRKPQFNDIFFDISIAFHSPSVHGIPVTGMKLCVN